MQEAKSLPSHRVAGSKLSNNGFDPFSDLTLYRSIESALQYGTITKHGISFVVTKVCQFMSTTP